eukprot:208001_1
MNVSDVDGVLYQGWMLKRAPSGVIRGWKRRYFVLSGSDIPMLFYAKSQPTTGLMNWQTQGSIDLQKAHDIYPVANRDDGKDLGVNIRTKKRLYELACETIKEQARWIEALKRATKIIHEKLTSDAEDENLSVGQNKSAIRSLSSHVQTIDVSKLETREKIIHELLTTEIDYCKNIEMILVHYAIPLKDLLKKRDHGFIFDILLIIDKFHEIILRDLEKHLTGDISAVFVKHAASLRCYGSFINSHEQRMDLLASLREKSSKFRKFCNATMAEIGQSLEMLLINPVQRIPRYELLLKALLQKTATDHPHYGNIANALEKIKETNKHINESKRRAESKVAEQKSLFLNRPPGEKKFSTWRRQSRSNPTSPMGKHTTLRVDSMLSNREKRSVSAENSPQNRGKFERKVKIIKRAQTEVLPRDTGTAPPQSDAEYSLSDGEELSVSIVTRGPGSFSSSSKVDTLSGDQLSLTQSLDESPESVCASPSLDAMSSAGVMSPTTSVRSAPPQLESPRRSEVEDLQNGVEGQEEEEEKSSKSDPPKVLERNLTVDDGSSGNREVSRSKSLGSTMTALLLDSDSDDD